VWPNNLRLGAFFLMTFPISSHFLPIDHSGPLLSGLQLAHFFPARTIYHTAPSPSTIQLTHIIVWDYIVAYFRQWKGMWGVFGTTLPRIGVLSAE